MSQPDPRDHGNLDTRLEPCRRLLPDDTAGNAPWRDLLSHPGVEAVSEPGGARAFASAAWSSLRCQAATCCSAWASAFPHAKISSRKSEPWAAQLEIAPLRGNSRPGTPLYRRFPEAWLESQVRQQLEIADATLLKEPVYGQIPTFAGGERGVLDLSAVGRSGRLTMLELKASADLHLRMQALDYWIRVKWHLDRGEFTARGYFPGIHSFPARPARVTFSPSREFHPSTETLLGYYSPTIEVERVGLGVEWRRGLEVMFRLTGAPRPR